MNWFLVLFVILLIPLGKFAEAFAEGDFGRETEVALEGGGICVCGRHIARLHGDELLVGFEVVVSRQHLGPHQFFLQGLHKVEQVLGLAATDVIDCVGRDGQAVFTILLLGGFLHHPKDAFHNVINVGKVAAAVAVVVNLNGLATQQLVGEAKVGHIGTTGRAIDGEEAQARGGDVVKLAVAMRHQLVALLGGGIEAHGVVHTVVGAERHLFVAAIDAGATGINQMLNGIVAAGFEDVVEADDVALDIHIGVLDAIAHTGLSSEIYHDIEVVFSKELIYKLAVGYAALHEVIAYG